MSSKFFNEYINNCTKRLFTMCIYWQWSLIDLIEMIVYGTRKKEFETCVEKGKEKGLLK